MTIPNPIYSEIAEQALAKYPFGSAKLTFLQHSDNVSFRVDDVQNEPIALLRIHASISPAMGTHGIDAKMVESEMLWLEALSRNTNLPTPRAIRNINKQPVTTIHYKGSVYNCSALGWLSGELYTRELECADYAAQVGEIAGTLHHFASQWRVPSGFSRPNRYSDYFAHMLEHLTPAIEDGRIARNDFNKLNESMNRLAILINKTKKNRQLRGLLHGDMHKGNFLLGNGTIKVIDFSFCSFGHYLYDLAICFSDMRSDLRGTFLEHYQKFFPLPPHFQQLMEGYYLGSMVATFAMLVDQPHAQENLVRRVPVIAQEFATRFNRDELFWFTDSFQNFQ